MLSSGSLGGRSGHQSPACVQTASSLMTNVLMPKGLSVLCGQAQTALEICWPPRLSSQLSHHPLTVQVFPFLARDTGTSRKATTSYSQRTIFGSGNEILPQSHIMACLSLSVFFPMPLSSLLPQAFDGSDEYERYDDRVGPTIFLTICHLSFF